MSKVTITPAPFADKKTTFTVPEVGRIRYNGLVHTGDLMRFMRKWFTDRGYLFVERSNKHKYGSAGLNKFYEWRPRKNVYDYLAYEVRMLIKILDIVDVEVIREGKKERLQQCRFLIEIKGILSYDPYKRFGSSELGKNLQALYHRFFSKKQIIYKWQDAFETSLKEFKEDVVKYLEFESTLTV